MNFLLPGKYKFLSMSDYLVCAINMNDNLACYKIFYAKDKMKVAEIVLIEKSVKHVSIDV